MKYKIICHDWNINLLSPEAYINKHDDSSRAITTTTKREIDFRTDEFTIDLIRHELYHAYIDYQINFFTKDVEDQEENNAEFFEIYGKVMIEDSEQIYKLLGEIE